MYVFCNYILRSDNFSKNHMILVCIDNFTRCFKSSLKQCIVTLFLVINAYLPFLLFLFFQGFIKIKIPCQYVTIFCNSKQCWFKNEDCYFYTILFLNLWWFTFQIYYQHLNLPSSGQKWFHRFHYWRDCRKNLRTITGSLLYTR